jgi:hypothetical protein
MDMSAQTGSSQLGFDPSVFGPFGAAFQAFSNIAKQDLTSVAAAGIRPEAVMEQMSAATKGMARVQLEVMGFAVRRTQAYMQVPTQLARCRTPQDFANEQMNFWRTAMEQYIGSSHRIMEAWTGAVPAMRALGANGRGSAAERERDYISFTGTNSKDANGLDQAAAASGGARRVA